MLVKAKVSFSGLVSMSKGEVKEINDEMVLNDLLHADYIEAVKVSEEAKNESKRVKPKRNM